MSESAELPVLVVGAGPAGLTAANLLGSYGVKTVLVEANASVSGIPKALMVDDEFFRLLATLGLAEQVQAQSVGPITYDQYSPLGFRLGSVPGRVTEHNYNTRSAIFQPWFEKTLLGGVRRFSDVEIHFSTELARFEDRGTYVTATLRTGDIETRREFSYVLAADGAHSPVRKALGLDFDEVVPLDVRHIVVDVEGDPDTTTVSHLKLGRRRHSTSLPSPNGRRYEFSLLPDEDPDTVLDDAFLAKLFKPFRDYRSVKVIRKAVYVLRARLAARMSRGRVFLLGDAAHIMPVFGSQGMNSGARDANNLAWKIAAVLKGKADPAILESYDAERREAVAATIRAAAGSANRQAEHTAPLAILRDLFLKLWSFLPGAKDRLAILRYSARTPLRSELVIGAPVAEEQLVGRLLPNPAIEIAGRPALLDEVLGSGFALVGFDVKGALPKGLSHDLWREIGARSVVLRKGIAAPIGTSPIAVVVDDRLDESWRVHDGEWLLVRPDRIVVAAVPGADLGLLADEFGRRLTANTKVAAAA